MVTRPYVHRNWKKKHLDLANHSSMRGCCYETKWVFWRIFSEPDFELRTLRLTCRVTIAAFVRSQMNGSLPFKGTIKHTTGTMPLTLTQYQSQLLTSKRISHFRVALTYDSKRVLMRTFQMEMIFSCTFIVFHIKLISE